MSERERRECVSLPSLQRTPLSLHFVLLLLSSFLRHHIAIHFLIHSLFLSLFLVQADPNISDSGNNSPLIIAATLNSPRAAKLLIKHGADKVSVFDLL